MKNENLYVRYFLVYTKGGMTFKSAVHKFTNFELLEWMSTFKQFDKIDYIILDGMYFNPKDISVVHIKKPWWAALFR